MNFKEAEMYLLSLNVGQGYNNVVVTKRTGKRIYLSNNVIVHIKDTGEFKYLDAKGDTIKQVLRDIEGYMVYLIHSL
jgi:hypothetical protein